MRTLVLNVVIGTLLFVVTQVALAETRVFVMPDGSKVSVDVPQGMSYTREEAVRSWEAINRLDREARVAEEGRKAKPAYSDSTAQTGAKGQRPKRPEEKTFRTPPPLM